MKVIVKASIILIALSMLVGTIMIFLSDIKILFTRESAAYLSNISDVNHMASVLFCIGYLFVTVLVFRKFSALKVLTLLLVLILWLLCGRVVAFKAFPDGRVITGWYYIETNKFNLCENDVDCEGIISKETTISKLPLWRIRINSKYTKKIIFVGPFTSHNCYKVFESQIEK
ncbi:hypothetical protein FAM09_29720 [Niastella caeni]|uniref:Uncharacterized protein n=1 Tax=Niastella caeni TaxID=2569763 RepID=A0A4S8H9G8_9BACT|nr:hypothetical protein [Niastella caeni]THU30781.1 hypothetical protein FAM09_29720 [Niastella caeni]